MIGERGVTLSGGQKQRISIARALAGNHEIVIFDDCLSAVDARTEKEIITNLYNYLQNKTAFIITHRIFSLFEFDRIIVLDKGKMVESGTHQNCWHETAIIPGFTSSNKTPAKSFKPATDGNCVKTRSTTNWGIFCQFHNNIIFVWACFYFLPKTIKVAYENNDKRMESVYSKRIRAGKRRTYFFDVRATRSNDYYLTITESRKKFNEDGYDRHKIFLYKEDFNKFIKALTEAVDYVKTDLMPDFDFDAFNHDQVAENGEGHHEHHENHGAVSLDPVVQVSEVEPVKMNFRLPKLNLNLLLRIIWKRWINGKES